MLLLLFFLAYQLLFKKHFFISWIMKNSPSLGIVRKVTCKADDDVFKSDCTTFLWIPETFFSLSLSWREKLSLLQDSIWLTKLNSILCEESNKEEALKGEWSNESCKYWRLAEDVVAWDENFRSGKLIKKLQIWPKPKHSSITFVLAKRINA